VMGVKIAYKNYRGSSDEVMCISIYGRPRLLLYAY
jgi:hypothetical protein